MKNWHVIMIVCFLLVSCPAARATDFYVAPDGNDAWSGELPTPNESRTDGPLATFRAARDAARKLGPKKPRRILARGGDYFLGQTFALEAQDSGLTIEAAPGEKAALYGGRKVTAWKPDGEHFWSAKLPEVTAKRWDFRMLVVNGRFCKRARLPRSGFFTHLSEFKVPWMSTTGGGWRRKPTHVELTTLKYRPEDLGPWLATANAELTVYHMWDESVVGVASMDEKAHTLTFSNPAGHPPGAFRVNKYVVWNLREGMNEPGQWYLDRTSGKVVYWPLTDEDMTTAKVIAPTIESILRVRGTKESPVTDVTLRNLTLSVADTPLIAGGFGAGKFDGAVSLSFARNCRLLNLTAVNVAGQGIKARNCTDLRIENCEVRETGACGIIVRGSDAFVADNHVFKVGLLYPSAIGIWCGGKGAEIAHNEVHDTPYTAIACGGDGHRIENNLIYRAMKELHDGAGIYITFCKGIILRGNFIRDIVDTGGYGASAYYLDEQAEACLVENNLSLGVARPSHNHMARNNTIRNNVFISDGDARLTFPKSSGFRFEKNIIYAKGKISVSNPTAITISSSNIFSSQKGVVEGAPPETLQADPLFVDAENGDYRFTDGSAALKLGIKPVDVTGAGRRGTAANAGQTAAPRE